MVVKRDPRTRATNESIWSDLPETVFRRHLMDLEEKTNAVPIAPIGFATEEWHSSLLHLSEKRYTLPIEVEQQLADDFAWLVAVDQGAQSVAAVCVEEQISPPAITLRFAALDISTNGDILSSLREWCSILSSAAKSDTAPSSEIVDSLLEPIIKLHFQRLLARLRSSKWEKPKYLSKTHKKPLWQDFENLIHRAQFAYIKKERPARLQLEKLLRELQTVYEAFEISTENDYTEMKRLVMASYTFCSTQGIHDYLSRLEDGAGPTPTTQVAAAIKSLRQIQKIAALRRIPIALVNIVQRHPDLFASGMTISHLTPFASIPTTIGYEEWATTCHVHAEVQLAVHYDIMSHTNPQNTLPPRTIGISKSLCYLCYQFLRAHGNFFPSRTHGRLYDQWTIPDLVELDMETAQRYRAILNAIDNEVVRHAECEPELWRAEPMTSLDIYSAPDGDVMSS